MLLYGDNIEGMPKGVSVEMEDNNKGKVLFRSWTGIKVVNPSGGTGGYRSGYIFRTIDVAPNNFPALSSEKSLDIYFKTATVSKSRASGIIYTETTNNNKTHFIGARVGHANALGTLYTIPLLFWNKGVSQPSSGTVEEYWEQTAVIWKDGFLGVNGVYGDMELPGGVNNYYIEVRLDPSDSTVSIWVDDVEYLMDVFVSSLTQVDKVGFGSGSVSSGDYSAARRTFDDIYFLDTTGDTFNDRLGPVRFKLLPLLAEDAVTWTPDNAESNIAAVNKSDLDTDSYNISPGENNKSDTFTVDTSILDPEEDILGVMVQSYARKDGIDERSMEQIVTTDGQTERKNFGAHLVSGTFSGSESMLLTKAPDDSAWDIDTIDNTIFGYEVKE